MRRFVRFVIGIVLLLAATVGVGSVHRALPSSLLSMMLMSPDGSACERPCLFGIRPSTTLHTALALFHAHPFMRRLKLAWQYNNSMRFSASGISVAIDADNGRWTNPMLISVYFYPETESIDSRVDPDSPIKLGEVLSMLGEPETVYAGFDHMMLFYFGNHLLVNVKSTVHGTERLDHSSAITAIVLTADPDGIRLEGKHTRWLGFTTIQHYEQSEH
jgi:hypothetical protein